MNHLMTDESIVLISCMTFGVLLVWNSMKRRYRTYPPWFYCKLVFSTCWVILPIVIQIYGKMNPLPIIVTSSLLTVLLNLIQHGVKWLTHDYRKWKLKQSRII